MNPITATQTISEPERQPAAITAGTFAATP